MAEVNNITNIAREIVSKLDADDKNSDGKIEASIWNKFVCNKQGNEIGNYINTDRALKSVIAYLKREAAKTGQAIEDIANEWLGKLGGNKDNIDKTQIQSSQKDENACSVPAIVINENVFTHDDNGYRNLTSEEKGKSDEIIDNATTLLLDVSNDNYRYKLTDKSDKWHTKNFFAATLADGRHIAIIYEDKNDLGIVKIENLDIRVNKNKEELSFNDGGMGIISENIGDGSALDDQIDIDFSTLIEKIFGNALREKYGSDIKIDANIQAWKTGA